jgi:hypothetical protein
VSHPELRTYLDARYSALDVRVAYTNALCPAVCDNIKANSDAITVIQKKSMPSAYGLKFQELNHAEMQNVSPLVLPLHL